MYALEMTGATRPVCNFNESRVYSCDLKTVDIPLQCPPFTFYIIAHNKAGASKPSEDIIIGMFKSHSVRISYHNYARTVTSELTMLLCNLQCVLVDGQYCSSNFFCDNNLNSKISTTDQKLNGCMYIH